MKAYKFKIEAVLKLRKIKEEKCRTELGSLIANLNRILDQIEYDYQQLDKYSDYQGAILGESVVANKLQVFPYLMEGKKRNLDLLKIEKLGIEKKIEEKKKELTKYKADLKVIEKLKEKDFESYKKTINKEISEKVEEQSMLWLNMINGEDQK